MVSTPDIKISLFINDLNFIFYSVVVKAKLIPQASHVFRILVPSMESMLLRTFNSSTTDDTGMTKIHFGAALLLRTSIDQTLMHTNAITT
jgi:hypothetical protein